MRSRAGERSNISHTRAEGRNVSDGDDLFFMSRRRTVGCILLEKEMHILELPAVKKGI